MCVDVTNELRRRSAVPKDRGLLVRSGYHFVMGTLQTQTQKKTDQVYAMRSVWKEGGVRRQGKNGGKYVLLLFFMDPLLFCSTDHRLDTCLTCGEPVDRDVFQ